MSGLGHRVRDVRAIAIALLAGAAGLTAVLLIVLTDSPEANARAASSRPLPLQTGQAWYSQTLDTSPATAFTSGRKPPHELIDKWVT